MSGTSRKHDRDRSMEFKGFLNDLQDWDYLLEGKDYKKKSDERQNSNLVGNTGSSTSNSSQFDYLKYTDPFGLKSGINYHDETLPDAASEKELGNEYFKQKKFLEAIECYSRSIALSPTSVAFANRAMAYLKLKRYEEAENDCTEVLNLDDRYVKAYSRRATARKELGKLKESMEDADFAVRLEPNNQELRKQYSETKALYQKAIASKKSEALKKVAEDNLRADSLHMDSNLIKDNYLVPNKVHKGEGSARKSSILKNEGDPSKYERKASLQDVASRAASRAMASTEHNIAAPKSAYEFEVSWRALSNNSVLQAQLLKTIPPHQLPQIFKNALSASVLVDIIKCTATIFREDNELAVSILDNMTKVPRFDMISMCLTTRDRTEVQQALDEIFSSSAISVANRETLVQLRSKYRFGELKDHLFGSNGWELQDHMFWPNGLSKER